MNEQKAKVLKFSLGHVKRYYIIKNYGRAYAHFIVCLELDETSRDLFEDFFVEITLQWCKKLEREEDLENCRYCYNQALRYFPKNTDLLSNFATHYMRNHKIKEALILFQEAYNSNPNDLKIEKNMQSLYAKAVSQWHYQMLNDQKRNEMYKQAIENHLGNLSPEESCIIIDIGTGSGILSLFASKFAQETLKRPVRITAVELSETLCDLARNIFQENNAQVELLQKCSTELHDQREYDFLITEIFDCGLFGEGVLSTLIHAHQELLKENAVILPHSAKLHIFGIESKQLDEIYRFNQKKYDEHGDMPGNIKFPKCLRHDHIPDEPYDAITINLYDYKRVTTIEEVVKVDFSNLKQLTELYRWYDAIDDVDLKMIENGVCHLFVVYFELFLDPEEKFKITTNPLLLESDVCLCWEQAVFSNPHPNQLKIDDTVTLNLAVTDDKLCIREIYIENLEDSEEEKCICSYVTREAIKLLNCTELHHAYDKSLQFLLKQERTFSSFLEISSMPLFSTKALKIRANSFRSCSYLPLPFDNADVAEDILNLNNIEDKDCEVISILRRQSFDIIVFEPVLENGLLNEEFYKQINKWQRRLKPDGIFIPTNVTLCFELVESQYLEKCTHALKTNLLGLNIAKEMNRYAVMEMRYLHRNFERRSLSTVGRKTLINDENSHEDIISVQITENGRLTGFLYWFESWYFTPENLVSTRNSSFNMAAFVLESGQNIQVSVGSCVTVKVKQDCGLLKISL